ncbi:hypothetical protein MVEN_01062500 [Mycena venus]|uniref:DUF6534 domain-containing protein n=1 Tax=Mycena venus TaxID=2733690 RepID=A0A8H7CZL1_9AGAR|nr:hypothetical protein MVEN_01062500 [Mycena venus]
MSEGFAIDVEKLTTPIFIGTIMNWMLLGALAVQIHLYFIAFPRDETRFKLLIAVVFVAEILQTLSDTRDTIRIFGAGWGDYSKLDEVGWSWFSVPVIGSTVACLGQIFFAWRIYIISRSLVIPSVITFITTLQLGAGLWSGVEISRAGRFSELQFNYFKPPVAWLSATAACDLVIVASTCFYLLKSRHRGFQHSTDRMVFRIIKVTVETGLLCTLFALADLSLYVRYRGNNYHLAVCIELSKVYSNSIMIILNSRAHIGHTPPTQQGEPSEIRFSRGPSASSTIQVISSTTEKYDTV